MIKNFIGDYENHFYAPIDFITVRFNTFEVVNFITDDADFQKDSSIVAYTYESKNWVKTGRRKMKLFIAEKPSLARAIAVGIGVGKNFDGYISLNGGNDIVTGNERNIQICQK